MAVTIEFQTGLLGMGGKVVVRSKHTTTGVDEVREIPLARFAGVQLQLKGDIKDVLRLLGASVVP